MDPHDITQDEKEKLMEDMIKSLYPGNNQISHYIVFVIDE